jgi:hypothetical protein
MVEGVAPGRRTEEVSRSSADSIIVSKLKKPHKASDDGGHVQWALNRQYKQ